MKSGTPSATSPSISASVVVVDVAHDHVEPVVGDRVALGLRVPRVQPFAQRRAARLDGEVDDRGRPAEGRRPGPALEGVLGERAAERQLHVRVHVDRAGDHVLAGRVDRLVGGDPGSGQVRADERDRLPVDEDVGDRGAVGGDDGAVADQRAHAPSSNAGEFVVRRPERRAWPG